MRMSRPSAPARQDVFCQSDALQWGFSPKQIRHRVATGRWRRLCPGWYAIQAADSGEAERHRAQVLAVMMRLGLADAVASHESAALLLGMDLLAGLPARAMLTCDPKPGRYCIDRGWARLRVAELHPLHVIRRDEVSITSGARTVLDLARDLRFVDAVVAADSALRIGATDRYAMQAVLRDCNNWPGHRQAGHVVAFADGRAESPLESASRVLFRAYGVEPPELQVVVGDAFGPIGRVDFLWRRHRTVGEADGLGKYIDADVLRREKLREERLRDAGFEVVRWTFADAERRPEATVGRVLRAFERSDRNR